MSKYLCIEDNGSQGLNFKKGLCYNITLAHQYLEENIYEILYSDEYGIKKYYLYKPQIDRFFIPIAEWREQQINSILDE